MTTLVHPGALRVDAVRSSNIPYWLFQEVRAAVASFIGALAERRRRLEALDTFHRIDARTLKDLGIDRARVMLAG